MAYLAYDYQPVWNADFNNDADYHYGGGQYLTSEPNDPPEDYMKNVLEAAAKEDLDDENTWVDTRPPRLAYPPIVQSSSLRTD